MSYGEWRSEEDEGASKLMLSSLQKEGEEEAGGARGGFMCLTHGLLSEGGDGSVWVAQGLGRIGPYGEIEGKKLRIRGKRH